MPDALNNQPFAPVGRGMAAGRESSPAASSVRGKDGRISADSFRLLTARLKSGPVTTVSLPMSDSPLRAPDVAPVNANAESLENQSADALTAHAVELPPFEPASLSEMDVPLLPDPDSGQAATWVEAATANDVAAVESVELQAFEPLQSVAQITLPEFTPVQWQGPAAVPEEHAAEPVVDSTSAPDMLTADLLPLPDFVPVVATPAAEVPRSFDTDMDLEADERQDPGMAFAPEAVVASDDDIEPEPVLPQLLDTATPEVPAAAADDVQPDLAFELQSDVSRLEVQPAEASEPLSDLQLEIESHAEEADELLADVPPEPPEIAFDARSAVLVTEKTSAEILPEHLTEGVAELPPTMLADTSAEPDEGHDHVVAEKLVDAHSSDEQRFEALDEQPEGEPEESPEDEPEEKSEPAGAPEVLADSEAEHQGDPKGTSSELAGRVVEAMIKTISTAIYAKPTASERAAFLREVAVLMQEASEKGSPVQQPQAEVAYAAVGAVSRLASVSSATTAVRADIPVTEAIAERLGPAPLLKAVPAVKAEDPFALSSLPARFADAAPAETVDPDEESGDLALTLLDMMSGGTGSLPHERTLAADTLLRILPRIPVKQLLSVVERVAIMETPPALLVAKLIRDPRHEVVGPLLERCSHISDQDLMNAAPDGDTAKLRMVARRRILSTVLSDFLISIGETGVLLTLIRNPGAALSHEAFFRLADHATKHSSLLAPLATRADLPPPVAFELFWHVPPELRRFIFSRFLTDSETLNKILRITLSTHGNDGGDAMGEGKFPPREAMDQAIGIAASYRLEEASAAFAEMGGITRETAFRILSDRDGEPLTVLLKALGSTRARFEEAITKLRLGEAGVLRPDRNPEELQAIFDGLSFNKARILLTYWDWFVRKAGPYAPHN